MLPIEPLLPGIVEALRGGKNVVVEAPTGAGKTTCVPPAILAAGLSPGRILLLEPRRLAARAAAHRMAELLHQPVGHDVGYHVRFDRRARSSTRILVVTEGILMRMLLDDPFLEDVDTVIFDEFHERRLDSDLALGMIVALRRTVRPWLGLVVMSATLPAESLNAYLQPSSLVRSEGRLFPVDVRYVPRGGHERLNESVLRALREVISGSKGDVLVFLPGLHEIRGAERLIRPFCDERAIDVVALYGDLPLDKQYEALRQGTRRRVILATNVAETSVTVEGVTAVIDSGLERRLSYDSRLGLDRLQLTSISRASARQRAGRAGRTAAGTCVRLWSEVQDRNRPEHHAADVRRLDLSHALLHLLCWVDTAPETFPWYEAPRPESLDQARRLLTRIGAMDERNVTPLGRELARLPVPPRVGRLLIEGARLGVADRAAMAAALLSERDPFTRPDSASHEVGPATRSDLLDRVECLEQFERTGTVRTARGELSRGAARGVLRVRDQLSRTMKSMATFTRDSRVDLDDRAMHGATVEKGDSDDRLLRAVLAAFPDRLAKRRGPGDRRAVMENGRGVRLTSDSGVLEPELFLCLDVDASQSEALVRCASEVRREWLSAECVNVRIRMEYSAELDRVVARRQVLWGGLVLEESPASVDSAGSAEVLAAAARDAFDDVRPSPSSAAGELLARIGSLRQWFPDSGWPALDDDWLRSQLIEAARGCRSFEDLRERGWFDVIRRPLSRELQAALDRDAPPYWVSPSGHRVKLVYEVGRPPVLAVRMQELFGLGDTPRVAGGRVPLVLHLLAPNHRPVQVTDDLPSFWRNIYPGARRELSRRYPKHAWPENPLIVPPRRTR